MAEKTVLNRKIVLPLLYLVSLMLIVILQLGFVFLLLAMLPSVVAYYSDSDYRLSAFRTVFASNLAGTMPYLVPMLAAGLRLKHFDVGELMSTPRVWLVIYGSAALGWCILFMAHFIAHVLLEIQYKMRVVALERAQAKLLEEWGDSIRPAQSDAAPN